MKKIIIFLGLVLLLVSCQMSSKPNVAKVGRNLTYFKDAKTGICFAAVNSYSNSSGNKYTSITCVPCDSLKKVKVEIVK
jgi:hypothetical protein